jgi:hypothetical protein
MTDTDVTDVIVALSLKHLLSLEEPDQTWKK